MNSKMKRRLIVVTGVIVVVLAIVLAIVGSSGAAKTISVKDALESDLAGERVQVSGNVVDNSFATVDGVLTFDIYDPDGGDPAQKLHVSYDGAASSTFGNGVTAICTGKIVEGEGGLELVCSELVTKCPSKYESATDALSVTNLLDYGDSIINTTVKLKGTVKAGTLTSAAESGEPRFVVVDASDASRAITTARLLTASPMAPRSWLRARWRLLAHSRLPTSRRRVKACLLLVCSAWSSPSLALALALYACSLRRRFATLAAHLRPTRSHGRAPWRIFLRLSPSRSAAACSSSAS